MLDGRIKRAYNLTTVGARSHAGETETMTNAIDTARAALLTASLRVEALRDAAEDAHPTPADDCDEDTFDAWNDAHEDWCEANGLYAAEADRKAAEDALIRACRDGLSSDPQFADTRPAWDAALGENGRYHYGARCKVLDLCRRLDGRTVNAN